MAERSARAAPAGVDADTRAGSIEAARAPRVASWADGACATSILMVTHDEGGGVERVVAQRARKLAADTIRPILVRPVTAPAGNAFAVSDGRAADRAPRVLPTVAELAAFLRDDRPTKVEFHHVAAHHRDILRLPGLLAIPYEVVIHDYAMLCARVTLLDGRFRYCGEPDCLETCEACVAEHGARVPLPDGLGVYRERQATMLRLARRIAAPSEDAARRVQRFVPEVRVAVTPWEDDARHASAAPTVVRPGVRRSGGPHVVGVVGAIGPDKGYAVLRACARDAQRRGLPIHFVVVGHTIDDERLVASGHVTVTGRFVDGTAPALLRQAGARVGFLPSIWPETWCFALSALWEADLRVLAFDLGAQAERIAGTGRGITLPLGASAETINDALVLASRGANGGLADG